MAFLESKIGSIMGEKRCRNKKGIKRLAAGKEIHVFTNSCVLLIYRHAVLVTAKLPKNQLLY